MENGTILLIFLVCAGATAFFAAVIAFCVVDSWLKKK
jgi:hypothetical protein